MHESVKVNGGIVYDVDGDPIAYIMFGKMGVIIVAKLFVQKE